MDEILKAHVNHRKDCQVETEGGRAPQLGDPLAPTEKEEASSKRKFQEGGSRGEIHCCRKRGTGVFGTAMEQPTVP